MTNNIKRAYELLDNAIDPETDDENDPWLQVEKAKDLLDEEVDE